MKQVSLSGSLREGVGKKDAKKARLNGRVPCVLYGGDDQIHFTLDERDMDKLVFTPDVFIVSLSIDGKEYQTILQDVQYHPVSDKTLHADFLQIIPSKPIKIGLPVQLQGTAVGVVRGGRMIQNMRKLKVKGRINDLPDYIEIDVSNMKIGDLLKVEDLEKENVKFLDIPSELVVAIRAARIVTEDEEEEGEEGAESAEGAEGAEGEAPAEGAEGEKTE